MCIIAIFCTTKSMPKSDKLHKLHSSIPIKVQFLHLWSNRVDELPRKRIKHVLAGNVFPFFVTFTDDQTYREECNLSILNTWNESICIFPNRYLAKKRTCKFGMFNLGISDLLQQLRFASFAATVVALKSLFHLGERSDEVMRCTCLQPVKTTHQRLSGPSGMESAICWWHLLSHSRRIGCPFWTSDCSTKTMQFFRLQALQSYSIDRHLMHYTFFQHEHHQTWNSKHVSRFHSKAPLYSDTNWQPWHLMELVHVELDDHSAGPWEKPKNFVAKFGGTGSFCG